MVKEQKMEKIRVKDLWENTYEKGKPYSDIAKLKSKAEAYLKTAKMFKNNISLKRLQEFPCFTFFLGENFDCFTGNKEEGIEFCKTYLKSFQSYFKSIKKKGYNPEISKITVDNINHVLYLADGSRRVASLMALDPEQEIEVVLEDKPFWKYHARDLAEIILKTMFLEDENKEKVLYQPIKGMEEYSCQSQREEHERQLLLISEVVGDYKGKKILDVGSCFGYYSFELAKKGCLVTGIEKDGAAKNLSVYIARINNFDESNPCFIHNSFQKYIKESTKEFDFALLINFMHTFYNLLGLSAFEFLNLLAEKTKFIILSMNHQNIVDSQEKIPAFICSNTCLKEYKKIGEGMFGRLLYLFYK